MVKLFVILLVLFLFAVTSTLGRSLTEPCINGTKLCFGIPGECPSSLTFTCKILVLVSSRPDPSEGLDVDVYGNFSSYSYYAFGFVEESGMSGGKIVHCNYNSSNSVSVTVGEGHTQGYTFIEDPVGTLTRSRSTSMEDGIVHCYWNQKESGIRPTAYNIRVPYYVQLAYGNLQDGKLSHHKAKSVTDKLVNLTSVGIIPPSKTLPILLRIHGSLMTFTWLFLVSTSLLIARYHKDSWGDTKMCGVKVWFALHRGLMVSAICTAVLGMISIFVHVGGLRINSFHQYFGFVANILMILQPIGALLRPAPDHPNRIFFNTLHFLGGNIGHILAIFAIFFSTKLDALKMPNTFNISLYIFIGIYLITHFILHFHPNLLTALNVIEERQMSDLKNGSEELSDQITQVARINPVIMTIEESKKRVLILFVPLVTILTIALNIMINQATP